jgi:hypothetical protein
MKSYVIRLSSSMQYLAFLSALQAVRLLRLHPLSQLELRVCNNNNIDWRFLIHLFSRLTDIDQRWNRHRLAIHPLPAWGEEGEFREKPLN